MNLLNKDFRLSKSSKRVLATFIDNNERGQMKKMLISAELAVKEAKMAKFKEKQGD